METIADPQPNIRQSSGNLVKEGKEELKEPEGSQTPQENLTEATNAMGAHKD